MIFFSWNYVVWKLGNIGEMIVKCWWVKYKILDDKFLREVNGFDFLLMYVMIFEVCIRLSLEYVGNINRDK